MAKPTAALRIRSLRECLTTQQYPPIVRDLIERELRSLEAPVTSSPETADQPAAPPAAEETKP